MFQRSLNYIVAWIAGVCVCAAGTTGWHFSGMNSCFHCKTKRTEKNDEGNEEEEAKML